MSEAILTCENKVGREIKGGQWQITIHWVPHLMHISQFRKEVIDWCDCIISLFASEKVLRIHKKVNPNFALFVRGKFPGFLFCSFTNVI